MTFDESGQMCFEKKPKLKIKKPIRLIELFAGIGAQAMALRDIGADFERYRVVEFDKFAIASYNAIHGTDFPTIDIRDFHGDDLGIVDTDKYCYILFYSFPCTDLSVAGKMAGMGKGTRSGLLWEVERLLNETKTLPQILIMENVRQVHGAGNKEHWEAWLRFLREKGYKTAWADLNATDYGVPQNRVRTFAVSFLGDYDFRFPEPEELKECIGDRLEPHVAEKYYLNLKGIRYVRRSVKKYTQLSDKTGVAQCAITAKGTENWTGNFIKEPPEMSGGYNQDDNALYFAGCITGGRVDGWHEQSRIIYAPSGVGQSLVCRGDDAQGIKVILKCSQIVNVERERERTRASKTIRAGGRGSCDRHSWDLLIEQFKGFETKRKTDRGYADDESGGIARIQGRTAGERGNGKME